MKLAAVTTAMLLALVWLLASPAGRRADQDIVEAAGRFDRAHPAVHALMRFATTVGEPKVMLVAMLVPAAFGPEVARATVRVGFACSAANQFLVSALKWTTNRRRPTGEDPRSNSSFPSGHAAGAAGLAWVVADRHRRLTLWVWVMALWISASRVFLSRHYPSDVLAGALVGILMAALAIRFEHRLAAARDRSGRSAPVTEPSGQPVPSPPAEVPEPADPGGRPRIAGSVEDEDRLR